MKNSLLILFLVVSFLGLNGCCKNDDDNPTNPIDQLPPATQTGAQTFGCLINGEAFLPDNFGSGRPNAFYQFVGGKYTLVISASRGGGENEFIVLEGIDVDPIIEQAYQLKSELSGNYSAIYNKGGGMSAQ